MFVFASSCEVRRAFVPAFIHSCPLRAISASSASDATSHSLADPAGHFVVAWVRGGFVQEVDGFSAGFDPLAFESDVADDRLVFLPLTPIVLPEELEATHGIEQRALDGHLLHVIRLRQF